MNQQKKLLRAILLGVGLFLATVLVFASTFVVDEGEQVVVLWLNEPIDDPVTEPGLHFKVPFFHELRPLREALPGLGRRAEPDSDPWS